MAIGQSFNKFNKEIEFNNKYKKSKQLLKTLIMKISNLFFFYCYN